MTDDQIEARSYTAATGKRPMPWRTQPYGFVLMRWFDSTANMPECAKLPYEVWIRLEGDQFEEEEDALAAADVAYLLAVADGAIEPISFGAKP